MFLLNESFYEVFCDILHRLGGITCYRDFSKRLSQPPLPPPPRCGYTSLSQDAVLHERDTFSTLTRRNRTRAASTAVRGLRGCLHMYDLAYEFKYDLHSNQIEIQFFIQHPLQWWSVYTFSKNKSNIYLLDTFGSKSHTNRAYRQPLTGSAILYDS
jgi:hypothetical protein